MFCILHNWVTAPQLCEINDFHGFTKKSLGDFFLSVFDKMQDLKVDITRC